MINRNVYLLEEKILLQKGEELTGKKLELAIKYKLVEKPKKAKDA